MCALAGVHAGVLPACCRCKETGESKVILTTLCGHGHMDMAAYAKYLEGDLKVCMCVSVCLWLHCRTHTHIAVGTTS